MQLLNTVLCTFLLVLTRRICLITKFFLVCNHFLYSHDLDVWSKAYFNRKIRCKLLLRVKGLPISKHLLSDGNYTRFYFAGIWTSNICKRNGGELSTHYTQTSVCILFIQFSIYFLQYWHKQFVKLLRA